ncbi:MAG: ABC transporter substrate-binding protein [Acidobacteriota bacterium]|nr:ABC transporter substrate-binding protein [Acidobacteriota bacterium]
MTQLSKLGVCLVCSLSLGCGGPVPGSDAGRSPRIARYDPNHDPLVNSPRLFEPYPAHNPEVVARDETLIRYLLDEPRTLNPIFAIFREDHYLSWALFDRLVTRDATMKPIWNRSMVEHAEFSPDHTRATIRLRPGLRWHDGVALSAHDVRFTWQAVNDDSVPAAGYKHGMAKVTDVEVFDDRNLVVHFLESDVTNIIALMCPPIPRHIWDNARELANDPTLRSSEYHNHWAREEVVGSGPMRFVEWVPKDKVVVERWDDHPDRARTSPFKRILFRAQPDRNLGLLLFKKGELDEYWMTPQQFATQSNDEEFAKIGLKGWAPARRIGRIALNQDGSNPFFADVRVRRAMAHAYDMDRVLKDVTYNLYVPSKGIFDPQHLGYNPEVGRLEFDLEKAAVLIEDAGWLTSKDDGWRYKEIDGQQVRFTFELEMAQTYVDAVRMANIYREDLRRVGVEMTTRIAENATHETHLQNHEFQAAADADEVTTDPDQWSIRLKTESYDTGRNYTGYSNPEVDRLFAAGRTAFDPEKRREIYREIHRLTYEDQAYMMMWNYTEIRAYSKRLRGIELAPSGSFLFQATPPPDTDWWTSPGWWVHVEDVRP